MSTSWSWGRSSQNRPVSGSDRTSGHRPRSTQELAPLVGVTEAALSKHLRTLAEAGLLERHRDGYYVLYRIVPDQVAALAPSLEAFLEQQAPAD